MGMNFVNSPIDPYDDERITHHQSWLNGRSYRKSSFPASIIWLEHCCSALVLPPIRQITSSASHEDLVVGPSFSFTPFKICGMDGENRCQAYCRSA